MREAGGTITQVDGSPIADGGSCLSTCGSRCTTRWSRSPRVPDDVTIRRASTVADVMAASDLLDSPARDDATRRFLDQPDHHLLVAHLDGDPVGMVSGVELTHPDKGAEMFLYELGVAEPFRGRGIGRRSSPHSPTSPARPAATACGC